MGTQTIDLEGEILNIWPNLGLENIFVLKCLHVFLHLLVGMGGT